MVRLWSHAVCLLIFSSLVNCYYTFVDETKFHFTKSYLCRYGYMNENVCQQHADDSSKFLQNNARDIYRGLLIFQTMFNIPRTGKIDQATILKMSKSRCGNKDFDLNFGSSRFSTRKLIDFNLLRSSLSHLTYTIMKNNPMLLRYAKTLTNAQVEETVEKAFKIWFKYLPQDANITKIDDIKHSHESNITIMFMEGNHGDDMFFDGLDGDLAHAYSLTNKKASLKGHIHLDDAENWEKRLLPVLLHEIGHIFGLEHSNNPDSIMSPIFQFNFEEPHDEDIKNLKLLLRVGKSSEVDMKSMQSIVELLKNTTDDAVNSTAMPIEFMTNSTDHVSTESSITETITTTVTIVNSTTEEASTSSFTEELSSSTNSVEIENVVEEIPEVVVEEIKETSVMMDLMASTLVVEATHDRINETTTSQVNLETSTEQVPVSEETTIVGTTSISIESTQSETTATTITSLPVSETIASTPSSETTPETIITEAISSTTMVSSMPDVINFTEEIIAEPENRKTDVVDEKQETMATTSTTVTDVTSTTTKEEEIQTSVIIETTKSILEVTEVVTDTTVTTTTEATTTTTTTATATTTATTTTVPFTTMVVREEVKNLCVDPEIDAITRTEWGNAFIFKGNHIWHIRGLTKWRLFDYDGWPKQINDIFPGLPGFIDGAYFHNESYYFTKDELIWKYNVISSYPPKYLPSTDYPKFISDEFKNIPFNKINGAISTGSTLVLFKDDEFWQNGWPSNMTGKMPFKADAVLSWRHPNMKNGLNEPLAYIVSNTTMYKFNYWNYPPTHEVLDTRYFLFDCVKISNSDRPGDDVFVGPSYKQAFIENDIYKNSEKDVEKSAPEASVSYVARFLNDKRRRHNNNQISNEVFTSDTETVMLKQLSSRSSSIIQFKCVLQIVLLFFCHLFFL